MSVRYLARGETTTWFHVGRAIAALGAVAGIVIFFVGIPILASSMLALFGILSIWLEIWAVVLRNRRLWIEVQDDGFIAQDTKGERTYRDAQVVAMAYTNKNVFLNGNYSGFKRMCKLWMADTDTPLIFENQFKAAQTDPLAPFIQRISEMLAAGFTQALEHGHALEGDGWSLTQNDLSYRKGRSDETISVKDIYAVEDHDGKLGVWRIGEDLPCAQFPTDGRNTWVLRSVLNAMLAKNPVTDRPATGLGRILFQRGAKTSLTIFLGVLTAIPLILIIVAFMQSSKIGLESMFIAVSIGLLLWTLIYAFGKFRCHERGVFKAGLFGTNQLMYKDMKSFTYSATRQYNHGAYVGTRLVLKFEPISAAEHGKGFGYSTSVSGADDELDKLRDFISKVIASRMQKELAAGAKVAWTSNISFLPNGFEFKPGGFFGRKDAVFMPYTNYGGSTFAGGQFCLFEKGNTKPVLKEPTAAANFFPGWFLLQAMTSQPA